MMPSIEWSKVRAVVFDLDGTLYRQRPVRLSMGFNLLIHALTNRHGLRDLLVLMNYRRYREELSVSGTPQVSLLQFSDAQRFQGLSELDVQAIVEEWMEKRPRRVIRKFRYPDIDEFFNTLKSKGTKIGVLSDYPVKDKLIALDLKADAVCCSTDHDVDRLKPDPAGLKKLLTLLEVSPDECVMVGDRMDLDGNCAASIGIPFLCCTGKHFYTKQLSLIHKQGIKYG